MKYLKIQNDGILDIRLVALMGGTTKSNDHFKIGQFGTGLKYTLAYLFRNNIDFHIFSGEKKVVLGTETEVIKDIPFEIICVEGHRTSMTTSMGHQWTAWMIIRELWCNALDEGSNILETVSGPDNLIGAADKTTFFIQITPDIQNVIDEWGSYFIHGEKPMWENDSYAIYPNDDNGKLKLYKHGVLIYQHPNTPSLFNYDIKGADINELREFRGITSMEIFNALRNPGHDVIAYFLQNIKEEHYEGSELDYEWFSSFANTWKDTIGNRRLAKYGDREYYESHGINIDFKNVIELPKRVYKALVKGFEGIGALVQADSKSEFFEVFNEGLSARIDECLHTLSEVGYKVAEDIKIRFGIFREITQAHSVNRNKRTIFISEACMKMDNVSIINILVENVEYINTKVGKDDARFYQHFVNLYTSQLLATNAIEI